MRLNFRFALLYALINKITTPLKLIFEASLKLKELGLPHDCVNANGGGAISAVYKKGKKSELCKANHNQSYDLRVFCAK